MQQLDNNIFKQNMKQNLHNMLQLIRGICNCNIRLFGLIGRPFALKIIDSQFK